MAAMLPIAILFSCGKDNPVGVDEPEDPDGEPDTEVVIEGAYRSIRGEVTGEAAEKTIGPEGGELVFSANGMKLKVPPGAVDKPVNFSIREVTYADRIKEWRIAGGNGGDAGGTLSGGQSPKAVFTAASTYPEGQGVSNVSISVRIKPSPKSQEIWLHSSVSVLREEYVMYAIRDGYWYTGDNVIRASPFEPLAVDSYDRNNYRMHIQAPATNPGVYPFGKTTWVTFQGGNYYSSTYTSCSEGPVNTEGKLKILDVSNNLVTGEIEGVLAVKNSSGPCWGTPVPFKAKFRYKKP